MKITINDVALEVPEGTLLAQAMEMRQLPSTGVATAVNGKVIPVGQRAEKVLADGDKVVIIKAFYGG